MILYVLLFLNEILDNLNLSNLKFFFYCNVWYLYINYRKNGMFGIFIKFCNVDRLIFIILLFMYMS